MESIDPDCTKLKQEYEACFYAWYSEKFLKGQGGEAGNECHELFRRYRTCLEKTLRAKRINEMLAEHHRLGDEATTPPDRQM